MQKYLIRSAQIVNEGKIFTGDVLIKGERIEKISASPINDPHATEINAEGLYLFPGLIDDQVHFREPGLTHKGEIYTEARAAVAGGITSYMEMPNTNPQTLTQQLLEEKYARAAEVSLANYSFYMGTSNENYEEVMKTDLEKVCGLKIFMGSSTGNMLVDDEHALSRVFSNFSGLIALHCEDEETIKNNLATYKEKLGDSLDVSYHPLIRSHRACALSSSKAIAIAKKYGTRIHILHISTAEECSFFDNTIPLEKKHITAEACVHHLWFSDEDYKEKGNFIKWNPAIKSAQDRQAIWQAVLDGRIDVIATDHAPHTLEEKQKPYLEAPSGGPLVQHALQAMLESHKQNKISLEMIAHKMSHQVATLFRIRERGFIREGYYADLILVDMNKPQKVTKENLLYKCKWSPFEQYTFSSSISKTWVNGHLAFNEGTLDESNKGRRLSFQQR